MIYVYTPGLGFFRKPELCERAFVYLLSLPANIDSHYQQYCCQVIFGTRNPSNKTFVGIVLQELLFMGLVSLLCRCSFWWSHMWPTSLNTSFQKDTFVPKNLLSFYFHWVLVLLVLISIIQGSESLVACLMMGRFMLTFPVIYNI